ARNRFALGATFRLPESFGGFSQNIRKWPATSVSRVQSGCMRSLARTARSRTWLFCEDTVPSPRLPLRLSANGATRLRFCLVSQSKWTRRLTSFSLLTIDGDGG